jgi:hypothetical protein
MTHRAQVLTIDQLKARHAAHVANELALTECARHSFKAIDGKPLPAKYFCPHCGGMVNAEARRWYERGLTHGTR